LSIAFINGSPKSGPSASGWVIEWLWARLKDYFPPEKVLRLAGRNNFQDHSLADILACPTWVVAFPLYVDGVPAQLAQFLDTIIQFKKESLKLDPNQASGAGNQEETSKARPAEPTRLYVVANNGFYQGSLNCWALESLSLFAQEADLVWGQGIGFGGGPMLLELPRFLVNFSRGPFSPLTRALKEMVNLILAKKSGPNLYVDPALPASLYAFLANQKWRLTALKRGCFRQLKAPSPKVGTDLHN
jgi:hypothetical protein